MKMKSDRKEICGIWGKELSDRMNITLAFRLVLSEPHRFTMDLSAASSYRVYIDGKFTAFGPARAPHGYARICSDEYQGRKIVVEVNSVNARSFCWIKQQPFFYAQIILQNGEKYNHDDFECFRLDDRIQKVPRYSFQRGFTEIYRMEKDRTRLYLGEPVDYCKVITQSVSALKALPTVTARPLYNKYFPKATLETGSVEMAKDFTPWRDRAHVLTGDNFDGFPIPEWESPAIDEASAFRYSPFKSFSGALKYKIIDFSRVQTGFFEFEICAKESDSVWVLFDEVLMLTPQSDNPTVNFHRNACANVHKWTFNNWGQFKVSTHEPYTARYLLIVCGSKTEVDAFITGYENPDVNNLKFFSSNKDINEIVEAARTTLAHNSVDIYMDCPSRERAGWLCDSYFMSVADKIFTGTSNVEHAFLENYALCNTGTLPAGMIPMSYPSDIYGNYLPNWAMWFILEVRKYLIVFPDSLLRDRLTEKIKGILDYFNKRENEFGLLENLDGWVFIEWSGANDKNHLKNVNIPTNACYAGCLNAAAEILGDPGLNVHAESIKKYIIENAFDGNYFVDNLIRDNNNKLVQSGLYSEVCQYYILWFNIVNAEQMPDYVRDILDNFGPHRNPDYHSELVKANTFIGYYLRLDVLMREKRRNQLLSECMDIFLKMAKTTGTLWEHYNIVASCDHGFASYVVKWIIYVLTGYNAESGELTGLEGIGIDCEINIPVGSDEQISLTVSGNQIKAERK